MRVNEDLIKGKWNEFKGEVQKMWGKITDSELEKAKGDYKAVRGLIKQKYGDAKEDYDEKFENILNRYSDQKDSVANSIKDNIKRENKH